MNGALSLPVHHTLHMGEASGHEPATRVRMNLRWAGRKWEGLPRVKAKYQPGRAIWKWKFHAHSWLSERTEEFWTLAEAWREKHSDSGFIINLLVF